MLFARWHTVERHGLRPRDDKVQSDKRNQLRTTRTLSLRGESEASDAAIHRVSGNAFEFVCSLTGSQWIATGFRPRDDKVGSEALDGLGTTRTLSLRGESGASDAAIHRVSGNAFEFVCSLTGSQWIATGFRPRDDKVGSEALDG